MIKLNQYAAISCNCYDDGTAKIRLIRLDPATRRTTSTDLLYLSQDQDPKLTPAEMLLLGAAEWAGRQLYGPDEVG